MLSTIYALCLVLLLARRGASLKQTVFVGFLLLIPSIFLYWITGRRDSFTGTLGTIARILYLAFGSGRLLLGAFYLPMGMLLAKRQIPRPVSGVLLIVGAALMAALPGTNLKVLFQAIAAVGLVSLLAGVSLPDSAVYPALRKMSIVGYLIHMYVYTVFYWLVYGQRTDGLVPFGATTAITLLIAGMYTFLSRKKPK